MDVRIAVSRKLLDGRMQRVHCRSIADDVSHDIAGDALIAPRVCEMFRMEDYTDGRGENARNVRKARLNPTPTRCGACSTFLRRRPTQCPLMAQSRDAQCGDECPLSGLKRT